MTILRKLFLKKKRTTLFETFCSFSESDIIVQFVHEALIIRMKNFAADFHLRFIAYEFPYLSIVDLFQAMLCFTYLSNAITYTFENKAHKSQNLRDFNAKIDRFLLSLFRLSVIQLSKNLHD